MPRVLCVRDNFTYDRFHYKGREYNLPDSVVISPKNFRLLDAPVEQTLPLAPVEEAPVVRETAPAVAPKKARRRRKK